MMTSTMAISIRVKPDWRCGKGWGMVEGSVVLLPGVQLCKMHATGLVFVIL